MLLNPCPAAPRQIQVHSGSRKETIPPRFSFSPTPHHGLLPGFSRFCAFMSFTPRSPCCTCSAFSSFTPPPNSVSPAGLARGIALFTLDLPYLRTSVSSISTRPSPRSCLRRHFSGPRSCAW